MLIKLVLSLHLTILQAKVWCFFVIILSGSGDWSYCLELVLAAKKEALQCWYRMWIGHRQWLWRL